MGASKVSVRILLVASVFLGVGAAVLAATAREARATGIEPIERVWTEVVSEAVPTAFSPSRWTTDDFEIVAAEGSAPPPTELKISLVPRSLEWVRAGEVLVLPRARARVEIGGKGAREPAWEGVLESGGAARGLAAGGAAEMPIALTDRAAAELVVRLRRVGAGAGEAPLVVRYRARPATRRSGDPGARIHLDTSCSRHGLAASWQGAGPARGEWATLGCRSILTRARGQTVPVLELVIFWEGIHELRLRGLPITPAGPGVWVLQFGAESSVAELSGGATSLRLAYDLAPRFHAASLGLGLGPYNFAFEGDGITFQQLRPLLTLYGSYFLQETTRIVAFGASPFDTQLTTDFGLYLSSESVRTLDRRLSLHLMLGIHAIGFKTAGQYYLKLGGPQGVELVFADAGRRGYNLTLGGFILPETGGKSYTNLWLRWGRTGIFGELNYIAFKESFETAGGLVSFRSQALGASVGLPLVRFW